MQRRSPPVSVEEEQEYLSGLKLLVAMISLILVAFLMLLDTSIISTVSRRRSFAIEIESDLAADTCGRPFQELRPSSTP